MMQGLLVDCPTVDQGSVAAFEVEDFEAIPLAAENAMPTGHRRIADGQDIGGVAPDGEILDGQRKNRILERSSNRYQWGSARVLPGYSHVCPFCIEIIQATDLVLLSIRIDDYPIG